MSKIRFSNFELDRDSFEPRREGDLVRLGGKPLDLLILLILLVRNRGQVVSRAEIAPEVWHGRTVSSATAPSTILEIRKALGDSAQRQELIASVRVRGYRFVPDVQRILIHASIAATEEAHKILQGAHSSSRSN